MRRICKTAPFRGPKGELLRGSIAEARYIKLGELDQWVMIRGESRCNPPLIVLHGGPGLPETGFFRRFNASLEKQFTVVYLEQRGAGKSFHADIPQESMTVEQFIADLDALVDAILVHLCKSKIVIYGHSWGSALGVLYAARFPLKVSAYVGAGQIGDLASSELQLYNYVRAEAERRCNSKALKELRDIDPPPRTSAALLKQRKWLLRFAGFPRGMSLWKFLLTMRHRPEVSIFDLISVLRGLHFSLRLLWPEISNLNLATTAPELKMPVFFFIGRCDRFVAPETSLAYFEKLREPKTWVWFEKSAHDPAAEEPEKFNSKMIELVLPVAVR